MKFSLTVEADNIDEILDFVNGNDTEISVTMPTSYAGDPTPPAPAAMPAAPAAMPAAPAATIKVDENGNPEMPDFLKRNNTDTPAVMPAAPAAMPPAAAAAPAAMPAAAPPTTAMPVAENVQLDADGIPWDKRIHAGTKSQTDSGCWRLLRNVNAELKANVLAELKAKYAPPAPPTGMPAGDPTPPTPPAPPTGMPAGDPTPPTPPAPPTTAMPAGDPTPPAPPTTAMPAGDPTPPAPPTTAMPAGDPTPPAPPTTAVDFNAFMQKTSQMLANNLIDGNYFGYLTENLNTHFGASLNALTDVINVADPVQKQSMIDHAILIMQNDGKWVQ